MSAKIHMKATASPKKQVTNYPFSAKLLHWASALIIISMLFLGVAMITSLATWQPIALALHQSFGIAVLVLVVIRLLNKLRIDTPSLPSDLSTAQRLAAEGSHILLYLAMIALPLLGWLMQSANGIDVNVFGLFALPALLGPNIEMYGFLRELHGLVAWLLFALILLHIAGALYHGLVRGDNVLKSMTISSEPASKSKLI